MARATRADSTLRALPTSAAGRVLVMLNLAIYLHVSRHRPHDSPAVRCSTRKKPMKYLLPVLAILAGLLLAVNNQAELQIRITGLGIALVALVYLSFQPFRKHSEENRRV